MIAECGPEWADWICPSCANMYVEHDGNCYCECDNGTGHPRCVEPIHSSVGDVAANRRVSLIALCDWYEKQ